MNRIWTGYLAILMVFLFAGMSFAAPPRHGRMAPNQGPHGQGMPGNHGEYAGGYHDHFAMLIHRLNLTEAQKATLAAILRDNYVDLVKADITAMIAAKKDLINTMSDPDKTEEDVRAAYEKVSQAQEDLMLLRWRIMTELKDKVLTEDQKAQLDQLKGEMFTKMDHMEELAFSKMDEWIAKYAPATPKQ